MLSKKLYWLVVLAFACSSNNTPAPVPPTPDDEPQQYGVPFSGVSDPRDVVLYEVNIRAFSPTGDFQGVIDKLDHIKSLGVNTIWLMPIHPVGQLKSAGGLGSPYSVRDYLKVNSEYGDLAKLRELVQKAHDKNLAVIMDWVANHTSWDNPWISNTSWYTQDGSGNIIIPPGTNWQDVADLNYGNYDMRAAMIHAMKYWILEANVDGYRCDAVDYVPTDFWKSALDELKAIPNRKLIFLAEGGKTENFAAGFEMNYAWDFFNNLKDVYEKGKSATSIFTTNLAEYNSIPEGAVKLRYTTNHDLSAWEATPVEVFGGEKAALSASVITVLTSVAPLIYGSQEVGREELLPFFTRDPIDWSENSDVLDSYKKLFALYTGTDTFTEGTLTSYTFDDVAFFQRKLDEEEYMIIVNVRNAPAHVDLTGELANTEWTNAWTGTAVTLDTAVDLDAYGFLILKQ